MRPRWASTEAAAARYDVSRIIVGKPRHPRWRDRLRGSLLNDLVRGSATIDVLVTVGEHGDSPARLPLIARARSPMKHYLWTLGVVALTTGLCVATRTFLTLADQAMIYLLGILVASTRFARGPSLLAAIATLALAGGQGHRLPRPPEDSQRAVARGQPPVGAAR